MSKLFVFSADALVYDDMKLLKTLPNFKRYLAGGALINKVRTIYPTITYPVHTSISTGVYAGKHGILLNGNFEVGNKDWNWFADSCKWEYDIFRSAKEAGLSTAAVFWPVTGCHKYIDYNIAEYWSQPGDKSPLDAFKRAGTSDEVLKIAESKLPLLVERKHPQADDFVVGCTCEIIKKYKPDVMFIHPANIDAYRHAYGTFNEYVEQGVYETDNWIGEICAAMSEAGVLEETNFVLLSDHGQIDVKRIVSLNVYLSEAGFIRCDEKENIIDCDAYIFSGGLCAYCKVFNKEKKDEVFALLKHLEDEGVYGIGKLFTREEISEKEHVDGDFDFMLETDGFTSLGGSHKRPVCKNYDFSDYRYGRATHGYLPDKGPQPTFAAKGPDINNDVVIENGKIVDLAPTFADIMNINLPYCDGASIKEIVNK